MKTIVLAERFHERRKKTREKLKKCAQCRIMRRLMFTLVLIFAGFLFVYTPFLKNVFHFTKSFFDFYLWILFQPNLG